MKKRQKIITGAIGAITILSGIAPMALANDADIQDARKDSEIRIEDAGFDLNDAKDRLFEKLGHAEAKINALADKVGNNDNLDPVVRTSIVQHIKTEISTIVDLKSRLKTASTQEEFNVIRQEIRKEIKQIRKGVRKVIRKRLPG